MNSNYNYFFQILKLDSIESHNWRIEACSAVTGENLDKGLGWIVKDIASRLFVFES